MKENKKESARFEMTKKRHAETLEKAITEKKADKKIIPLLNYIKKTKNYFTSSSCSGRILLLKLEEDGSKREAAFHKAWHCATKFEEAWKLINKKIETKELWFKLDPFILHIGTNSIENSEKILRAMQLAGIKRGGIICFKEGRIIIEMIGTQNISFPVKINNKILIEKKELKKIIEKANKKLEQNHEQLKKLEKTIKQELK